MRAQPQPVLVHRQRLGCRPPRRPAHQPLHRRPGRSPKREDEGATARPLLHRRGREVRLPRRRMHEANIVSECGPHPGLPRIGQCSGFRNPSPRGRRLRRRSALVGRSPRKRTGERHLPRSVASPARGRLHCSFPQPPWNRLGRGTRQIRHRRARTRAVRRRCERRPRWRTARRYEIALPVRSRERRQLALNSTAQTVRHPRSFPPKMPPPAPAKSASSFTISPVQGHILRWIPARSPTRSLGVVSAQP
jgi:hypothetical protein